MRIVLLSLTLLIVPGAYSTEGVEIEVFSRTLKLAGNCKFLPSHLSKPFFRCLSSGQIYTVSFSQLSEMKSPEKQLLVDPETANMWHIKILSSSSENVGGLLHIRSIGVTGDNAIQSDQYQICDKSSCVTLTAESASVYENVILQLSPKVIETKENATDL